MENNINESVELNEDQAPAVRPSAVSDAFICIATVLICSFWSYEAYMSELIMLILGIVASLCLIFSWVWYSFSNGIRKKNGFAVFTAVFWLVPMLLTILSESITDPKKYNSAVHLLGELSRLLGSDAMRIVPVLKNSDPMMGVVIMTVISLAAFAIGRSMVKGRDISAPKKNGE